MLAPKRHIKSLFNMPVHIMRVMGYLNFVTKIMFDCCNDYQVLIHWLKLNSVTGIKMEFTFDIKHIDSPVPYKKITNIEFGIEADYYVQYQKLIIKTDAEYPIEHTVSNLDLAKCVFDGYLDGQVASGRLKLKSNHGGKRVGAGRPKGEEKKVYRCTKLEIELIKTIRSLDTNFDVEFVFEKLNEVAKKAESNPIDFHFI